MTIPEHDPVLMIPGPADVDDVVLAEMSRQVVAHYGNSWARFYNETIELLGGILHTKGDLFIYPGSGHLGLDAVIGSLFEPGSAIVVVRNGHFGERIEALALTHELRVIPCDAPWGEPVSPTAIAEVLDTHPEAQGLLLVHGETSTGLLNPVQEIAAAVKARDRLMVVDAVSTAGIAPLKIDDWGIDALVTASQKGLGAPPGVVIVGIGHHAWQTVERRNTPIRSWSINLAKWREYLHTREYQPYFVTMPVNVVRALRTSLEAIEAERLDNRIARHAKVSSLLRRRLTQMGLEVETPSEYALPSVTVFRCPDGVSALTVRDRMAETTDIQIAPGLGPWRENRVRIGHMGRNATPQRIEELCTALRVCLDT